MAAVVGVAFADTVVYMIPLRKELYDWKKNLLRMS